MSHPLDRDALERLQPLLELELHRRVSGAPARVRLPLTDVLEEIFVHLGGVERSDEERTRFLAFAAPLAREAVVSRFADERLADHARLRAFDDWFHRVQSFDPVCTRMIDLFYFGGLGARGTASLLGVSPRAVIGELRFAKAWWLQAQLRRTY